MASLADLATDEGEMASEIKETLKTNKMLLHSACYNEDVEYLRTLLDTGLDIETKDVKGQTPLFAACDNEDPACIQLLLEKGANPNVTNMVGQTPLHMACLQSNIDHVRLLYRYGANTTNVRDLSGRTPLFESCITQDVECVRVLLNNGAIPDIVDRSGRTPMDAILSCFQHDDDSLTCIRLLLEHGVSSNALSNVLGNTFLHVACKKNAPQLVRLLLKNAAYPVLKNGHGLTPMQIVTKRLRMQQHNPEASAAVTDALTECKELLQEALEELEATRKRSRVEEEDEEEEEEVEEGKGQGSAKRARHE